MAEPLTEGARVDGRYILERRLGEGTFGGVWRARDTRLSNRLVAVKILKAEFLEQPSTVARFEAEGEALSRVSHPNVVAVIDRGHWEGQRYLVTEFVDGHPLTAWLDAHRSRGSSPGVRDSLAIFGQLCAGMEAAHALRVPGPLVHRDLKPDNVLVRSGTDGAVVKIVDFGIAQLGGRSGTRTGALMGTPLYMAPEQAMGNTAAIGPWTDVFALGVILTEMLTLRAQVEQGEPWWGTALHRGASVRALLSALGPEVPPPIWDLVATCLQAHGRDRFQHAGALRVAARDVAVACLGAGSPSAPMLALSPEALALVPSASTPSRDSTMPGDTPGPVDRASSDTSSAVDPRDAQVPWLRLVGAVVAAAVVSSAALVTWLVRADQRRAHALADAGGPTSTRRDDPRARPAPPSGELLAHLRAWKRAVERPGAASDLAAFYAPRVRWHSSDVVGTPQEILGALRASVGAGGSLQVDVDAAEASVEDPASPDVALTCRTMPGASGPVLKVRALAEERRPDRPAGIPCPTLRGAYLIRARRSDGGLRICHETWSIADGICVSCPTAAVCPRPR